MIFLIGASLAFFLEFVLISKKGKSTADKILSVWMFVLGTHLLLYYSDYSGLVLKYHFLEGVSTPFPLLHGPLLYLYAKALTNSENRLGSLELLHFLPALIVVVRMIPFFLLSGNDKMEFVENLAHEGSLFMTIVLISFMVSGLVYITLSLLLLRRHRKFLVLNYSNTDRIDLNWLRYLIIGMIVIYSIVTIGHLLEGAFSINFGDFVDNLIFLAVTGFVIMIGYFGIKQTTIFAGEMSSNTIVNKKGIQKGNGGISRYQKSGLKAEQADDLQARLEILMREEKPFLNDKLTLKFLADKLDIHPNYLSQVINERFQRNFYDFINTARIEEFKALIKEPRSKNLTLLAVAFDCGFSSKSSFNKFFKKSTGQTPSDFLRTQNI